MASNGSPLAGKTVLVTGASRGIGKVIAQKFLVGGANVVLFARNEEALREVAAIAPQRALVVAGDMTNREDRQRLVGETVKAFGRIDMFIPNAGIVRFVPLEALTEEIVEEHLNVNFSSIVQLTRLVVPHMPQGSSIVFMSTSITNGGFPMLAAYAASKGAIKCLAQCLAVELAPRGISVNAIAPGPTQTDMWKDALPPEALQQVAGQILPRLLTGQFGRPEYVADMVVALTQIPTIRGQQVVIDGGYGIS